MKLTKDGAVLCGISNYREDSAFSPKRVHFDCRPPIHDVDGLFDLLLPNGHVIAISVLEQIADAVTSHVVARKVEAERAERGPA